MNVYAQTITFPDGTPIEGPIKATVFGGSLTIGSIVTRAIPFVYAFGGIALLLMLVHGGLKLLTSAGNPKGIESGKQQITYAVAGFFVLFASFWIVQIVGIVLGIEEIKVIFGGS